jgi:uncharacterized protein
VSEPSADGSETRRIRHPDPGPRSAVSRRRFFGVSAAVLAGLAGRPAWADDTRYFRIGTGTPSGTYFPLGGLIASAISNPPGGPPCNKGGSCGVPGLIAVAQATSGSVENINLLRSGALEAAFAQSDTAYWAATATGPFGDQAPFTALRSMGALYTEAVHLVVRADSAIRRPADIAGKIVSVGEQASGTLADVRPILGAYGIGVTALNLRLSAAAERLAKGELDAFFYVGGAPVPAIAELAGGTGIRIVPFDDDTASDLRQRQRFFQPVLIAEGTYVGVPDTVTLGVGAELVTTERAEPALVQAVTAALWNDATLKVLADGHPRGRSFSAAFAAAAPAIPLHEGAARYYREAGVLADEKKP